MMNGLARTVSAAAALLLGAGALAAASPAGAAGTAYPWHSGHAVHGTIADRFAPPAGFRRVTVAPGSFADWLRHLPLKRPGAPVRLHHGRLKPSQSVHAAVVDIETGRRDLQQCADAVMRLRAEYLYGLGRPGDIRFNFTNGDRADFTRWTRGWRPVVRGNTVRWQRSGPRGAGRIAFKSYLRTVFTYAGTWSLRRELRPVRDPRGMRIGDVFIEGGFPGHAVLVVDLTENPATGERRFMLVQSFMPAQDIHVLRNLQDPRRGVWYQAAFGARLVTPEWTFRRGDLRRFR